MQKPEIIADASHLPEGSERRSLMESALTELFFIEHPEAKKSEPAALKPEIDAFISERRGRSVWVHYPWRHLALEIPDEETYFRLRTARNRNLILPTEQQAYRESSVGIAGLSVGSAALALLVQTGGPKRIKLADFDTLEITNLNRIRAGLPDVGMNKTEIAARAAWELDPFAEIECVETGLSRDDLDAFLAGLTVFIDEMDDVALKVRVRNRCRELGIPVVMGTDNGDGAILDVERFNLEKGRPIFHGRISLDEESIATMPRPQILKIIMEIIDPARFTERQQDSMLEIGKSIAGVPQLATAATISGAAVAFAVRQIACGAPMPSGRYTVSLEESLIEGYRSDDAKKHREEKTKRFIADAGLS